MLLRPLIHISTSMLLLPMLVLLLFVLLITMPCYGFVINNQSSQPLIIKAHIISKTKPELHKHLPHKATHKQYEATHWQQQRQLRLTICHPTANSTDQKPICDQDKDIISRTCNANQVITIAKQPCAKGSSTCNHTIEIKC